MSRPADLAGARRAATGLRRRAAAVVGLSAAGFLALLGTAAVLLPPGWRSPGSPLPLLLSYLGLAAAAGAGFAVGGLRRRLALERLAAEAEAAAGLRSGELRAALDLTTGGEGSPALARRHVERVGSALARRGSPAGLFPLSWAAWRRRVRAAGAGAAAAGALLALAAAARPEGAHAAADALLRPWRVARPPALPPLAVEPRGAELERGSSLRVRVTAPGRRRVRLAWRVEGELTRSVPLPVAPAGDTAWGHAGPIEAATRYWAEDGRGAVSDTFLARPLDPLLLTDLEVRVEPPAYLGRPVETHARPLPALAVPHGSRLRIRGSANRPLLGAALLDPEGDRIELTVAGRGFEGELRPRRGGAWSWELAAAGETPARPADTLRVELLRDGLPSVTIAFPGADTVLGLSLALPLVLDARDDVGVSAVEVVSWRVSGAGARGPATVEPVPAPGAAPGVERRLILRPRLRAQDRGLLPGDTLVYHARVRDGNPAHPAVSSDTFRARVPGLGELRERAIAAAEELAGEAGALAEGAARLEREAREAERGAASAAPAGDPRRGGSAESGRGERASFAATEEGRRVLSEAEALEERLEGLGSRLDELEDALERSGLMDPHLREQLRQLEELYEELIGSGLGERIEELRRALRDLDAAGLRAALDRVSSEMRDLRERLEQSVALMERVAAEQAVEELGSRAERLAEEQGTAAGREERDEAWARSEERLAAEAERLAADLERLEERLAAAAAGRAADSVGAAGERAGEAAAEMRAAGAETRGTDAEPTGERRAGQPAGAPRERPERGRDAAAAAAGRLESAASGLRAAGEELRSEWRSEALSAVKRATDEALGLAREQTRLLGEEAGESETQASTRGRQAALRQGLENLADGLAEAGRRTALLDRRVGPAAARAAEGMDAILESLEPGPSGSRPTRGQGEAVVEALNELAGRLLASREAIEASTSATGMEEALARLARMAEAQGGLSQEGGGLLALQESGAAIAAGLRHLAEEQAAIARQLRELDGPAGGELLGRPEEMAAEAEAIAERLRSGGLDPETVARQERLFRRLLDAGRTLEKDEEDPRRRESRTAGATPPGPLPEPDPALLAGPRWPHPGPEALGRVPAAYRALVLEYFDRLNRGASPPEGEGGR